MSRTPRNPDQVLEDLEDGMASQIEQARALLAKVREQADAYEGALEDLEEGAWNVRPPKIEPNQWAMMGPFVQAARINSVRKALKDIES